MSEYYEPTINIDPTVQSEENKLVNRALTKLPIPHISGLKLRADVKLGDLVLNTIDEETGVVWVCTDIDGWWNLPDPEVPDLPRGWADGSYDARGRWAPRNMTLSGTFLTQDPEQVEAARAKLIAATTLVYRGDWLVVNETTPKAAFVRLSGRPDISTVTARGRTNFSIGLRAADPVKYEYIEDQDDNYSVEVITPVNGSGVATITNSGNIAVPIVIELSKGFTVADPDTPAIVTNTTNDQELTIIGSVDSASKLEIDTYNREVLEVEYTELDEVLNVSNGRAKVSVLIDWIYLEPGDNDITIADFPSGSTCTIYYRSGWIG